MIFTFYRNELNINKIISKYTVALNRYTLQTWILYNSLLHNTWEKKINNQLFV